VNEHDPEAFRALGHQVIDLLADHLRDATAGRGPVLPWLEPEEAVAAWPAEFPDEGGADPLELLLRAIAGSIRLHHPRYVGHQVTAPLPSAALAQLAGALLNNGMAVYEMGAAATAMERAVVGWMAARLGFPAEADGVLTSGGSAGNLTALLAMRGRRGGDCVLVGASAHYSTRRATRIMGWGDEGAVEVPVDARGRMIAAELPAALARARGRKVAGVVASACSTATGVFDPLPEIADFCAAHGLWLHVDGAHGAAAALSPRYRHLVAGIERADSVVWDGHKMLLLPALVTGVVFRDGRASYAPFAQEAAYLFEPEERWFDLATRTLECTKRMMSLELYLALATVGPARLGAYVEGRFDLARRFAARLAAAGDFEVIEPDCNIVCFRHAPPGLDGPALDARQERARDALLRSGRFYLVKTRLGGKTWLRVTIINPHTRDEDLDALADAVRAEPA
jgi:L-2,4-diaminobutyrate decarboxylase